MSSYKRNLLVGLTVVVALILLGAMILRFSDAPFRFFVEKEQMRVTFHTANAEGLSEGSPVLYLGVSVGRITAVKRDPDLLNVTIQALVDRQPPLPANVEGRIRTQPIGGAAALLLVLQESASLGAPPPMPQGILQPNASLTAKHVGADLLPKELGTLATSLIDTSAEFRLIARQFRESNMVPKLAAAVDSLKLDIEKAGKVIDSVHTLVEDPEMRKNLQAALANFRAASESATRIGQNLEKISQNADTRLTELSTNGNKLLTNTDQRLETISKQMTGRMEQLAKILDNVEIASAKLHSGKGSAAMLLNDPVLYENLLDTSKELKFTFSDFRRLVEQWEQEGLSFKLK